jgi:hypothetical protein
VLSPFVSAYFIIGKWARVLMLINKYLDELINMDALITYSGENKLLLVVDENERLR